MQQFDISTGFYLLVVEEGAVGRSQVEDVGLDVLTIIPKGVHLRNHTELKYCMLSRNRGIEGENIAYSFVFANQIAAIRQLNWLYMGEGLPCTSSPLNMQTFQPSIGFLAQGGSWNLRLTPLNSKPHTLWSYKTKGEFLKATSKAIILLSSHLTLHPYPHLLYHPSLANL